MLGLGGQFVLASPQEEVTGLQHRVEVRTVRWSDPRRNRHLTIGGFGGRAWSPLASGYIRSWREQLVMCLRV